MLATAPGLGDVALAAAMLLIILFRPQGIAGGREIAFHRTRKSARVAATTTESTGKSHV
jgi:hypothetical protein